MPESSVDRTRTPRKERRRSSPLARCTHHGCSAGPPRIPQPKAVRPRDVGGRVRLGPYPPEKRYTTGHRPIQPPLAEDMRNARSRPTIDRGSPHRSPACPPAPRTTEDARSRRSPLPRAAHRKHTCWPPRTRRTQTVVRPDWAPVSPRPPGDNRLRQRRPGTRSSNGIEPCTPRLSRPHTAASRLSRPG